MDWDKEIASIKTRSAWQNTTIKVNVGGRAGKKIIIGTALVSEDGEKEDHWEKTERDRR